MKRIKMFLSIMLLLFFSSTVYAWSDVKVDTFKTLEQRQAEEAGIKTGTVKTGTVKTAKSVKFDKWSITGKTDSMTGVKINSVKTKRSDKEFLNIITVKSRLSKKTPDFIISDPGPRSADIVVSYGNNNPGPYRDDMILMKVDTGKVYYFFATYWFRLKVYKDFRMSTGPGFADQWLRDIDKNRALFAWKNLFVEMRAGNKIRIRLFDGKEIVYSLMGFTKAFNKSFSDTIF